MAAHSSGELTQGRVIFMPDLERYHCSGFRAVSLLSGFGEGRSINPVPFAHTNDYLFNGDRRFQLRTHYVKSVFGIMIIPEDATVSCARMRLFPVARAYSIGDEIRTEPLCEFFSPSIAGQYPVRLQPGKDFLSQVCPMPAPAIVCRISHYSGMHRVEVDVADQFHETCLSTNHNDLAPPLKRMSCPTRQRRYPPPPFPRNMT